MKDITPINIWHNGQNKQANKLNAYIVHDNLKDTCTFYYELVNHVSSENPEEVSNTVLANGNTSMSGERYLNWDGTNEYAYEFIAEQINVELCK